MSYSEIIVIILSFLSIFICLFAIWLAIIFYRLYTQFSLMVTEMSKGLDVSTIRLERLPKILYNKEFILPKSNHSDILIKEKEKEKNTQLPEQMNITQKQEVEKDYNKIQDKDLLEQVLKEGEEI